MDHTETAELWDSADTKVIYKPPGYHMAFDEYGEVGDYESSMCNQVRERFRYETVNLTGQCNAGFAHRLDKPTSGCVLIGKTESSYYHLRSQFYKKMIYKEYVCLVYGATKEYGIVEARIEGANYDVAPNAKSEIVEEGGEAAFTAYQRLQIFRRKEDDDKRLFSLLRVRILTGRTHQIRIHMDHVKHALVGDDKYGSRAHFADDKRWCPRLFLHHYRVGFDDIASGHVFVKCEMASDLLEILTKLQPVEDDSAPVEESIDNIGSSRNRT
jgi:23S rRNA pseudouridine1911/1915/1917 synthase